MVFKKLEINRIKKRWEKSISEGSIVSVKLSEDRSILVHKSVVAEVQGKIIANTFFDRYSEDSAACKAMLMITGPMEPGNIHYFKSDWPEDSERENHVSTELLEHMIKANKFKKAKMKEESSIALFSVSKLTGELNETEFSRPELIEVILKETGPLKPGDVFHFKKEEGGA